MAKISPVSAKYIVHASISIDGVVDRPDVIGAIFGQTEGLVGSELELRELQRSGRIGRIEVNLETKSGKTQGDITIPSSLDKAETSIIAASMEIIERIGPCNAKIGVSDIEDVRVSKRTQVIERAKALLKNMMDKTMPDSQEIADEVTAAVRVMEIQFYGKEKLPAGPGVEESDEITVVEGRADVVNLLKYGFKNAIAINGSSVPETIKELSKKKTVTAFLDGDRGGDLNLRELLDTAEIDYVARAPDGKEVEELTKKEIHKALRARIAAEQSKMEVESGHHSDSRERGNGRYKTSKDSRDNGRDRDRSKRFDSRDRRSSSYDSSKETRGSRKEKTEITQDTKDKFKTMVEDLIGTKAVYFIDENMNVLGKVPIIELESTLKGMNNTHALVVDETITKDLCKIAKGTSVNVIVGLDKKTSSRDEEDLTVLTASEL